MKCRSTLGLKYAFMVSFSIQGWVHFTTPLVQIHVYPGEVLM